MSGIYEKTLIINLPGSAKASKECLSAVSQTIPHAVSLIKNEKEISKQLHEQLNITANNKSKIPVCEITNFHILLVTLLNKYSHFFLG